MGFQKRLLGRALIGPMKGGAAGHAAHRESLQQHPLAAQFRPCLVPINLAFLGQLISLRHAGRAA
jgi:hypothetical protein